MIVYNQQGIQNEDGAALGSPEAPLLLARTIQALGYSGDPGILASEALVPRALVDEPLPE